MVSSRELIIAAIEDNSDTLNVSGLNFDKSSMEFLTENMAKLKRLRSLFISNSSLNELPCNINLLENLEFLYASYNEIFSIPYNINELPRLKYLYLANNKLSEVDISNLQSLEFLYLPNNNIESAKIHDLKNLKYLCLSFNKINYQHLMLSNLPNLETLILVNCSLESLPEFSNFRNLKNINANQNKIKSIEKSIANLPKLESLSLYNNEIITVPVDFGKSNTLNELNLQGNEDTLEFPPKSYISAGSDAVISFLKSFKASKKVAASKIMIVGEGRVGKSCLVDSLLNLPFVENKPSTHGLNKKTLAINNTTQAISLNIWDFGGQDIYHATHQFYLTGNAIFVIVWNANLGFEKCEVAKWVKTINSISEDSPIFIVQTYTDERFSNKSLSNIDSIKNMIHYFSVDNKSQNGIEAFREGIVETAFKLKFSEIERPQNWFKALSEIKSLDSIYKTKNEIFKIFYENGLESSTFEPTLQEFKDLGEILYFQDEDLNDIIILKPEWVSQQIALILDDPEVEKNLGYLSKSQMTRIWHDLDISIHSMLLTLMEKFNLSYKTGDHKEISLIVEKLPENPPSHFNTTWDNFNNLKEIKIKYVFDIIPAGIPSWIIARAHRFSTKLHWKQGVIFVDKEICNACKITVDSRNSVVYIDSKGASPYFLLTLVRDMFDQTLKIYRNLSYSSFIQCQGVNGTKCTHYFEFEDLEAKLNQINPEIDIECPKERKLINIPSLLFGINTSSDSSIHTLFYKLINKFDAGSIEQQSKLEEVKDLIQLGFFKSYKVYQRLNEITCPNLFTLRSINDKSFLDKRIESLEFELQLFCQMPNCIHSIGDPYKIFLPRKWFKTFAKYYNDMIKYFKYILPFVAPISRDLFPNNKFENIDDYLDSVKDFSSNDPFISDQTTSDDIENSKYYNLKIIKRLLDNADTHQEYRGLRRKITPEGYILWLCEEHYNLYEES